ncbi:MAG: ABC transporter permease [Acidobacteria bacterium]|nr:ABC transporter permease [Acidobacteriota bacterium]
MDLPFELFVALRYLLAKRKQAFISVISLISTLGVMVGVIALVVALALMTGLQQEVRDRILGSTAHIFVWKQGGYQDYVAEARKLRELPHVIGAAPAIIDRALLQSQRGVAFITIKGIDPALEASVTDIERSITSGSLQALANREDGSLPGILIGADLSKELGAFEGDVVQVLTTSGTLSPMGVLPRLRPLRVVGVFSLGLYEFDSSYGFVTLDHARRLFDKAGVDLVQLKVDDIWAAPRISASIPDTLGPAYLSQDWADTNRSLFSALWLEKMAISITIGLIVMVAALNIVASLILLVMEKNRDIAILKTMGANARSVMMIFMLQGLVIGIIGTAAGASLGYGIAYVLDRYRLISIPMDVYQVSYVPFIVEPSNFVLVIVASIVICFLATLYPSRQAARLHPAQALRNE